MKKGPSIHSIDRVNANWRVDALFNAASTITEEIIEERREVRADACAVLKNAADVDAVPPKRERIRFRDDGLSPDEERKVEQERIAERLRAARVRHKAHDRTR